MKKSFACFGLILLALACQSSENNTDSTAPSNALVTKDTALTIDQQLAAYDYTYDTLALNLVRINGHPVEMSLDNLLKSEKIDSSRSYDFMCPSYFKWTDKTKGESWQTDYFSANRKYISNGREAIFDQMDMKGNSIEIPSMNSVFDETTTLDQFAKIFPVSKLQGELMNIEYPDELDVISCKVFVRQGFDDTWIFRFRDGKLEHLTLWWLLC